MSLLSALWQDSYAGRRCIVGIKNGVVKHFWFSTLEDAEGKAQSLDDTGHDVYFSPSQFDPTMVETLREQKHPRTGRSLSGREQKAVGGVSGLWLDLDWGESKPYQSFRSMMESFKDWWDKNSLPAPSYIIGSGRGVHVYWLLDQPYSLEDWQPVAQHLKQACALGGLHIDMTRTADSASLLRVPGTHHRKDPDSPQDVKVLVEKPHPVSLHEFSTALPDVGPQRAVPVRGAPAVKDEWDTEQALPPGDFPTISKSCQQIGHFAFVKGKVSEPYWRAALSVIWRCEDGPELIHTYSVGDERYDAAETISKAENTQGPATCGHFQDINPTGCEGCPFNGKITSPINISTASEKIVESDGEGGTEVEITFPSRYTVNKTGVYLKATEEIPATRLTAVPIWLSDIRVSARNEQERGSSHLHLRWRDIHGVMSGALIEQSEVHEDRALKKWLADHNLAAFVYGTKGFVMYINQLVAENYRQRGATTVYQQLGWHDDFFVMGKQGVDADGLRDVALRSSNTISQLEVRGSLSEWTNAVRALDKPEYSTHAFALCAALGSPILDRVGKDGAVIALVGASGRGKTLAAQLGISVFVDPKITTESGSSTDAGLELRLGANKNVPVLVDEVTTMKTWRLANLIYMAANGTGKATATRNREDRKRLTWRLTTFLTSNHSLMDQANNEIEEAHRQRLLEIPFNVTMPKEEAAPLYTAAMNNPGVAGVEYLKTLLKHADKLEALFNLVQRYVEKRTEAADANRFITWTLTAALLGGILGRIAGIITFNPVKVVDEIIDNIKGVYQAIEDDATRAKNALLDALNDNSRHVCFWAANQAGDYDVDGAVARVRDDDLFVQSKFMNKVFTEQKINRSGIKEWLDEVGFGGKAVRMRLSPNSPGPVHCYRFSMAGLDMRGADIWDTPAKKPADE